MANALINCTYVRRLHKNPKGQGLESFKVGDHMETGVRGALREHGISEPFPPCLLYAPLQLAVDLYPLSYPLIN